jgi:ABC-2 type transport system ATP-binding protein
VTAPALEVSDLVMRYGEITAVDGLSLRVEPATVTAILGPNGAGKTTTLETCEGYRAPQAGAVRVLGLDPVRQHAELAPRLGVMLQSGGAWSGVRAEEMLRYVASLYANPLPLDQLVDRLGLRSCGRTPYRRLSGGQQQRLGLAMAIVGRPEIVFLDEPTAGLDPQSRRATWELIEQLVADGVTVVLTTHYMEEAERLASRVVVVDAGRVVASGSSSELMSAGAKNTIRFSAKSGLRSEELRWALPEGYTVTEEPAGCYRVVGEVTPRILAAVTAWCAALDVMPEDLVIERHSLEDVFLDLTGKALRP